LRSRDALLTVAIAVIIVLFMGKTLGLPFALMMVSGESMKPTLNPFDIVVGVSPRFTGGVNVGDIVVVVLPGKDWRTTGVIHRVVRIYEDNGVEYVVTRGDNVGYDDPPVLLSNVRYLVVGRVPNYVTIPIIGIILGFIIGYYAVYYPYKRWETGVLPPPGSLAAVIVFVFALFNVAYVGAVYLDGTPSRFVLPVSIAESVTENVSDSSVIVELRYTNTTLLRAGNCFFSMGKERFHGNVVIGRVESPAVIKVTVPRDLWLSAWNHTSHQITSLPSYPARIGGFFSLHCEVEFSNGVLKSVYPLQIVWSEPLFVQGDNGSLVIVNKNPVPINISILLFDTNLSKTILDRNITIPGVHNEVIRLPSSSRGHLVRIIAHYEFLGVKRIYGGFING
jgi:signal peptidase I